MVEATLSREAIFSSEKVKAPNIDIDCVSIASERHPDRNEDDLFINPENNTFGIFDGMGGESNAQEASQLCSEIIKKELSVILPTSSKSKVEEKLFSSFRLANNSVLDLENKYNQTIGSTGTYGVITQESGKYLAEIISVGDSRAYIFRNGVLRKITKDASRFMYDRNVDAIQYFLDNYDGIQTISEEQKNLLKGRSSLVHFLGSENSVPNLYSEYLSKGDNLVLVTDGIHDNLTTEEMRDLVSSHQDESSYEIGKALVTESINRSQDKANRRAKPDDMTALVIKINSDPSPELESFSQNIPIPNTSSIKEDNGSISSGWKIVSEGRGTFLVEKNTPDGIIRKRVSKDNIF